MLKKTFYIILILNIILATNSIKYADDNNEVSLNNEYIDTISKTVTTSSEATAIPNLNSRIAIAYDRQSGKVIYGKEENRRTAMASTTKIMTAIILIENYDLNQTITVSRKGSRNGWFQTRFKER